MDFPKKNRNKTKYAAFLNTNFHTAFMACAFATYWKQPFRNVCQKTATPKKFENVLTKYLKNNSKTIEK